MRKHTVQKLMVVVLLALLTSPVERAFASSTGQTTSSSTSTTSPTSTTDGITGTDPEPIEPDVVTIILTLLQLS
ncbi:MAG TPA: hypothetical protein VGI45_08055 [Terracidiphilus sp.]